MFIKISSDFRAEPVFVQPMYYLYCVLFSVEVKWFKCISSPTSHQQPAIAGSYASLWLSCLRRGTLGQSVVWLLIKGTRRCGWWYEIAAQTNLSGILLDLFRMAEIESIRDKWSVFVKRFGVWMAGGLITDRMMRFRRFDIEMFDVLSENRLWLDKTWNVWALKVGKNLCTLL